MSQIESTNQTYNPDHEIGITSQNTNRNKLWSIIINQLNIKGQKKLKSTDLTHDPGHKTVITP
jgi:hypothetical protein